MSRTGRGAARADPPYSPYPSSKRPLVGRIGLLFAALLMVVVAATALALRSDDTAATVSPAPQTLAPVIDTVRPLVPGTVFSADAAPSPLAPPPADLAASFAELERSTDAAVGVALAPVGNGLAPLVFGEWTVGPAWSTIKVPLAMAALRQSSSLTDAAAAAITQSDNVAAEELWASLGDPVTAASSVEAVLREAGDSTTVESQKVRPEFSAFGQTQWPLANQAGFLAEAMCDPRNGSVLDLMIDVVSDQRWGLGTLPDARIKGGWGPNTSGQYIVRQIGIVDTPTGKAAVAVAAAPASGSFGDGVSVMNSIAEWLTTQGAHLPSGLC